MKARSFKIETDYDKRLAISFIERQPLKPVLRVDVKVHRENRTLAQNALMWKWHTEGGDHLGETKEDMHTEFKRRFVVPILRRDDAEYAKMVLAVLKLEKVGMRPEFERLRAGIIELTSTTTLNTAQLTEALTEYERHLLSLGAEITRTGPDYELSFKVKKQPPDLTAREFNRGDDDVDA
jgi:hypothetical protein